VGVLKALEEDKFAVCVAGCCNVLPFVAVCCSVLQCDAG